MTLREVAFALALLIAAALITFGLALITPAAGFIGAGIGVGTGAWLVLSE